MKKNKPLKTKHSSSFPQPEEILKFIKESPVPVGKREIARHFKIHDDQRIQLKRLLQDLKITGVVEKTHGKKISRPGALPDVLGVEITHIDGDDIAVRPLEEQKDAQAHIELSISHHQAKTLKLEALAKGDRLLVRLEHHGHGKYTARPIKRLPKAVTRLVGVVEESGESLVLRPTDRKNRDEYIVDIKAETMGAKKGDIVTGEVLLQSKFGKKLVRITENLGPLNAPRAVSLIAIAQHSIPWVFPDGVVSASEKLEAADLTLATANAPANAGEAQRRLSDKGFRTDLRTLPLITIDGADARDFDDAVHAELDDSAANKGGWKLTVAIADVSYYVKSNSIIDREAYKRGNSVYFPDRVVPMLPEALSNELCSLKPHVERACMVAHMTIDKHGELKHFRFSRALMKSVARTTYEQVQEAFDGTPNEITKPILESVIKPLYGAYAVLLDARKKRGTLELNIAERQIKVSEDGKITSIGNRPRLESHKLIEEFMVLANVAAARALQDGNMGALYRVHDLPSVEKIANLRDFLKGFGVTLSPGKVLRPADLAAILEQFVDSAHSQVINEVMLRSLAQAIYSPENIGHFGLALSHYAHFTSPIRRYADLIVHRALIRLFKLGEDGLTDDELSRLEEIGEHISKTERRAIDAERDASDRYTSLYLADNVGAEFDGRISGVTRAGLFVRLTETGADGFIPMNQLPDDYYNHDEQNQRLVGSKHGKVFRLADTLRVKLVEADPVVGGLRFSIVGVIGRASSPPRLNDNHSREKSGRHPFSGKRSFKKGNKTGGRRR